MTAAVRGGTAAVLRQPNPEKNRTRSYVAWNLRQ